jgi:hypothetical protein
LIDQNFDKMFDLARTGMNPRQICGQIRLCSFHTLEREEEPAQDVIVQLDEESTELGRGGAGCKICEKVIGFIRNRREAKVRKN